MSQPEEEEPEQAEDEESKDRGLHLFGGRTFLEDEPKGMTFGRRIAMHLMKRSKWYNPRLGGSEDDDDAPSLEKAWAFFEHVTLQRYVVVGDDQQQQQQRGVANTTEGETENSRCCCSLLQRCIAFFHRGELDHHMAEAGEADRPTELYSPFTTPLSQMGDFGIGYGLYFFTLRSIALLSLLLGIINIPNMLYFASPEYSGDGDTQQVATSSSSGLTRASAICTDQTWVPCPQCVEQEFDTFHAYPIARTLRGTLGYKFSPQENGDWLNISDYVVDVSAEGNVQVDQDYVIELFGYDENIAPYVDCASDPLGGCYLPTRGLFNVTGDTQFSEVAGGFALRNNCEGATLQQGFINYASLFVMIIGSIFVYVVTNRMEVDFDEDEQTAQDYSVLVKNPPPDAYSPDEWKTFFQDEFDARLTVCTVHVDNDKLTKALVARREILRKLEFMLPPGYAVDSRSDLEALAKKVNEERYWMDRWQARLLTPGIPEYLQQLDTASEKVKSLASREYPACAVFLTFETEAAQRSVLRGLSVGRLAKKSLHMFRGTHVLHVEEPEEPSTIRWQDLGTTELTLLRQLVVSTFTSILAILVALTLIQICYSAFPPLGGIATTVATGVYPTMAQTLTRRESHASETAIQKWLYIKIALFNVATTALYLQLATPFTATLDDVKGSIPGLITNVHRLFFSQLLLSPGLQILDPMGHFQRHILAPRAKTQAAMNNLMKGQPIDLSVRYGNMTKFVFLMLWYCAIYPAAFFMGAFSLFICYYCDRFCLMRSWSRAPHVGTHLSHFARDYVFPIGIVVMAVISAYDWSGFPYDNLCPDPEPLNTQLYAGDWDLQIPGTHTVVAGFSIYDVPDIVEEFTIAETAQAYRHCNQDLLTSEGRSFPALPKFQTEGFEWMTDSQETITSVYGWTTVAVVALAILSIVWRYVEWGLGFVKGMYTPRGRDMKQSFSKVTTIDAYIPQVQSLLYEYVEVDMIFELSYSPFLHEDTLLLLQMTKDVDNIMGEDSPTNSHRFAQMAHWRPEANAESGSQDVDCLTPETTKLDSGTRDSLSAPLDSATQDSLSVPQSSTDEQAFA